MKLYITTRFNNSIEKSDEIEKLSFAIQSAGFEVYCFVRDGGMFDDVRELWSAAKSEIQNCDGLLVDISDNPTGGRIVELGIAYALDKPIIVIVKNGIEYKTFYDGIANTVISYDEISDITEKLIEYRKSL